MINYSFLLYQLSFLSIFLHEILIKKYHKIYFKKIKKLKIEFFTINKIFLKSKKYKYNK